MTKTVLDRFRPAGTRNYIATGDMVRVDPFHGGPFLGRVVRIAARADVDPDAVTGLDDVEIDVVVRKQVTAPYKPHSRRGRGRTVTAAHVARVDQTLHPVDQDPPTR